jgi:tRNA-dihydrouridine synthase B
MRIGNITIDNTIALAPMAGVTDLPFRNLCKRLGAGFAPSEMVTSDTRLWHTTKSRRRLDHEGESFPRIVQIAGGDPEMIANAARLNVERGAHIIDINLGCPAKKVCNKAAGSALLKDVSLVKAILEAAVDSVQVPVTLKTRTGWSSESRNGLEIASIAEAAGIQAIAVHGRTRNCMYKGQAEYETIAEIKRSVSIPVIANGDITSPEKAREVLALTGADGLMVGRAAQGRPWIFREINHFLATGEKLAPPSWEEVRDIMLDHLVDLYHFYGEYTGVRVARKHLGWYCKDQPGSDLFWQKVARVEQSDEQIRATENYFKQLIQQAA